MKRPAEVCCRFDIAVFTVLIVVQSFVETTKIECIPLQLCPMAMKLIKDRPYDPQVINFLRFSHCGLDQNGPKIWCAKFRTCLTPDSKKGNCTKIRECEPYINILKNVDTNDFVVRKYLREFRCSADIDPEVRVCCPAEKVFDKSPVTGDDVPKVRTETCGKQNLDNKIFGGSDTSLDEFPWMTILKYTKAENDAQFGCGGALINKKYVITAAHCVDFEITRSRGVGDLTSVVLGEYDVRNETDCIYTKYGKDCADPVQEFGIKNVIIHPEFNGTSMINDIAFIELEKKVNYSNYIQPICLPSSSLTIKPNQSLSISGWGRTEILKRSPVKKKATVKLSPNEKCTEINKRQLSAGQICVGEGKGSESCSGDSGGPLMLEQRTGNGLVTSIVGIVSYGYGRVCGVLPGVYTYVPNYSDWITSVIYK